MPGPAFSKSSTLGSEDDFYLENSSTNGQYDHEPIPTNDMDASIASIYYNNSPIQTTPHARVPLANNNNNTNNNNTGLWQSAVKLIPLRSTAGPAALYPGPVRGAGYYSVRTDS